MATIPASENVFPEVLLAEVAAPAAAPSGQVRLYVKADGLLYWKDDAGTEYAVGQGDTAAHLADTTDAHDASAVSFTPTGTIAATDVQAAIAEVASEAGGAGSGQGLIDFARARRTSGSVTLNSTSWANVDTGLDLTLDATSGDWIEVGLSCFWGSENVNVGLDAATIVAAAPVNYVSGSAGGAGAFGVMSWMGADGTQAMAAGGSVLYETVGGDISAGTVTLRLRYRSGSAANRTLAASTNQPLEFWAKNIGPAL